MIKNIEKIDAVKCHKTKNFLVIIVKNLALTEYISRKQKDPMHDHAELEMHSLQDPSLPVDVKLEVDDALSKLPHKYREVLLLIVQGYTPKEIAEILGEPYETVRKRVQRARTELKKLLEEGDTQ